MLAKEFLDDELHRNYVDTTVDAARLEARATKRTRIFMARVWAIGPWTLPVVAVL